MKITARRVTDINGLRPFIVDGEAMFHDEMRSQLLGAATESIWRATDLAKFYPSTLQEMTRRENYNLLANRLMNVNGYPPDTKILYAEKSGVKIIEINGKQFASKGYTIYQRN